MMPRRKISSKDIEQAAVTALGKVLSRAVGGTPKKAGTKAKPPKKA